MNDNNQLGFVNDISGSQEWDLPLALPLSYEDKEIWLADGDSLINRTKEGRPYIHSEAAEYVVKSVNNFDGLLYTLYQAGRNLENVLGNSHHEDHPENLSPRSCHKCYLTEIHKDICNQLLRLDKNHTHDPFKSLDES